jgi:hypothetical protein
MRAVNGARDMSVIVASHGVHMYDLTGARGCVMILFDWFAGGLMYRDPRADLLSAGLLRFDTTLLL